MFENKKLKEAEERLEKAKKLDEENKEINEKLVQLKWQYETLIAELKGKTAQADVLIKQLTRMIAHIKKKYVGELRDFNYGEEKKDGE